MNLKPSKALLLSLLAVVACGRGGSDLDDAEDAVDTTLSASNESALMDLTAADAESASCDSSSDAIAEAASMRVRAVRLKDPACLTSTRVGNTVTYVLNACTGKYGYLTVTGTVAVAYSLNTDCSVDAVATGRGVKVNKATIDLDATGHYRKDSAGVESLVVDTHSQGTGARGISIDHSGRYTVTRDQAAGCRTLDGTWSTDWSNSRGAVTTSTVASGLKKCEGACPAAGGRVEHDGFGGRTLTLTFDGSAVAQWSTSQGKSGTIDLDCGQ